MKRKEQDALIRSAFGETEVADQSMLDAALKSEEGARQLQQLEWMKQDLVSLADVPECQLSNDRLKNAILGAGSNSPSRAPLIWKPLAVAAGLTLMVVAALNFAPETTPGSQPGSFAMNNVEDPVSTRVADENSSDVLSRKGSQLFAKASEFSIDTNTALENEIASATTSDSGRRVAPRRTRTNPSEAAMMAMSVASGVSASDDAEPVAKKPMANSSLGSPKPPEEKIIVVDPATDPSTRASEAQEVVNRDVVFGG